MKLLANKALSILQLTKPKKSKKLITYAADQASKSIGCVRIAALVNCFNISGNSGGMFICSAQYIVSGGGILATCRDTKLNQ